MPHEPGRLREASQVVGADLATGTRISDRLGPGGGDFVTAVKAFVADGRTTVIADTCAATIQTWELTTGAASAGDPIAAHADRIRGLTIAEVNGRTVAMSAGSDPALCLWDVSTHTPRPSGS